MDISIIIPLFNEDESLPELCSWIEKVMNKNNYSYEMLLMDDGSKDKSWSVIENISSKNSNIKGIKFRRNYGKSAALNIGFQKASGDVVITMDADLQDSPDEIPALYDKIMKENFDLVSGWKQKRYDPLSKTIPTKLFNWAARKASGIYLHDFNCGLKSYKNTVVKSVEVHGEMHRYIPVIASNMGYTKIEEQIVKHQARKYGKTKFGSSRFINGFLDLITIWFLNKFGKRPMHFFGFWGTLMLLVSFVFILYIGLDKLYFTKSGKLIAQRTEFFIALTSMIIGIQLFVAGFLGEMFLKSKKGVKRYIIGEKTN